VRKNPYVVAALQIVSQQLHCLLIFAFSPTPTSELQMFAFSKS